MNDKDETKMTHELKTLRVLFCQPLGPIDLSEWLICPDCDGRGARRFVGRSMMGDIPCRKCASNPGFSPAVDLIIVEGESGPNAQPMHPDWVRSIRDQCQDAGVAFWFMGWGEWIHESQVAAEMIRDPRFSEEHMKKTAQDMGSFGRRSRYRIHTNGGFDYYRVGKHAAGRLLDGREWGEFPAVPKQVQ